MQKKRLIRRWQSSLIQAKRKSASEAELAKSQGLLTFTAEDTAHLSAALDEMNDTADRIIASMDRSHLLLQDCIREAEGAHEDYSKATVPQALTG